MRTDVADILLAADAFVLTSLSEGIPVTILEAMRAGVPVIASNVGGVPELIATETSGILVQPQDAGGFAKAIVRLVDQPELGRSLSATAKARFAQKFSENYMLENYDRVFQQVLATSRRDIG